MNFTKDMIGQTIYAIPTGNNARGNKDKVSTFEVVSIGKIYVELRAVTEDFRSSFTDKYDPKTGATQSAVKSGHSGNAGYIFFPSMDSVTEWYHSIELRKALAQAIQGTMGHGIKDSLSINQMERILQILGETNV